MPPRVPPRCCRRCCARRVVTDGTSLPAEEAAWLGCDETVLAEGVRVVLRRLLHKNGRAVSIERQPSLPLIADGQARLQREAMHDVFTGAAEWTVVARPFDAGARRGTPAPQLSATRRNIRRACAASTLLARPARRVTSLRH